MDFMLVSIWVNLKTLKKNYQAKKNFIVPSKNSYKEHVTEIWNKFEKKGRKIMTTCT